MIAQEYSTMDMAMALHLSDHTILSHRKNLLRKLNVKNTAGLIRRAFELNYLRLSKGKTTAAFEERPLSIAL